MENACIHSGSTCWLGNPLVGERFSGSISVPIFCGFDGSITNDVEVLFHRRRIGSGMILMIRLC